MTSYWTRLFGNRNETHAAVNGLNPQLQGWWGELFERVLATRRRNVEPTRINRLSHVKGFVPGFETIVSNGPAIKILAPWSSTSTAKPPFAASQVSNSINTNGNRLSMRMDFGRTRVLNTRRAQFEEHEISPRRLCR